MTLRRAQLAHQGRELRVVDVICFDDGRFQRTDESCVNAKSACCDDNAHTISA